MSVKPRSDFKPGPGWKLVRSVAVVCSIISTSSLHSPILARDTRIAAPNFIGFVLVRRCFLSLNRYGRLRAVDGDGLHSRIQRSAPGDDQRGLPAGLGLERHRNHGALAGDSAGARWTSWCDGQLPHGFVFAVHQRYGLAVLR